MYAASQRSMQQWFRASQPIPEAEAEAEASPQVVAPLHDALLHCFAILCCVVCSLSSAEAPGDESTTLTCLECKDCHFSPAGAPGAAARL